MALRAARLLHEEDVEIDRIDRPGWGLQTRLRRRRPPYGSPPAIVDRSPLARPHLGGRAGQSGGILIGVFGGFGGDPGQRRPPHWRGGPSAELPAETDCTAWRARVPLSASPPRNAGGPETS